MSLVEKLIKQFGLQSHPEGGWYKQTYKSNEFISATALPERFNDDRVFSTAIYFLLEKGNFSAFHKIKSDECWHFYTGDPLNIYTIDQPGELKVITLGNNFNEEETFQYVVPANCWFASRPAPGSEYCLVGCTVAPGFEFEDFELADKTTLSAMHPRHTNIIAELCR
jgi:predicted cupin superfamily sugar epimerase